MKYVRMYAGSDGESHFEDVPVDLKLSDYSPPTPPVYISPFVAARQFGFVRIPAGWVGAWHPSPGRQVFLYLAGEMDVKVSDDERRRFRAGTVLLVEDTVGRGHQSRVVGTEDVILASVYV
jgi:quercetin dioxygenase-like cupin family protein